MKKDSVYLHHILDAIGKIEKYAKVGKKRFIAESHWQDAIIRNLEIIGEATKRLSEGLTSENTNIPWRSVAGLRDVLIHDYMSVDLDTVWSVIEKDLPSFKKQITDLLKSVDES
jgi:uncharacterized protein with HEPN domain